MTEPYLAPSLKDQGYTGATGTTPYKPASQQQLGELQAAYNSTPVVPVVVPPASNVLSINFDGTHNNGNYPATEKGESPTNIYQLSKLQRGSIGEENVFYYPGVGAQTLPSDARNPDGSSASGSSSSFPAAFPGYAGGNANAIIEKAYIDLVKRVDTLLGADPNATVSINLSGFSRGGAEAVAFANLLNERGIPGLYSSGQVPIDTMVLLDPVDMTNGGLNVAWPANVKNPLVMVAMNEGRAIMPAMKVGENVPMIGLPGAHADVGGSYNPDGVAAVALGMVHKFLSASGMQVPDIPESLRPDWSKIWIHNAALDNYGNTLWSWSEFSRYYENARRNDPSLQEVIRSRSFSDYLLMFLGIGNAHAAGGNPKPAPVTFDVNQLFLAAVTWILRKDPLTLDLDGDGLETIGINTANPILFDHEGDGIKTATGWVGPDDGFLTLDRNGNGMIDDGTELFGDSTPLYAGGNAEDGFAALAQEDSNGDGLVNASDANFANLRIWRDLNQNGVSEAGELLSLEESGIAALRTAKTEHSANLANGNQVADLGGFIRSDGTEGGMGAVAGEMGDINLADNPFYSDFTDNPPLTDVALALPGMNGSGQVRDLQSASVLSPDLTATLGGLAGYHTRAELLSQADALINQWAATSGMETGVQKAHGVGKTLIYLAPGQGIADLRLSLFSSGSGAPVASTGFETPADVARRAALTQTQGQITNLIALLERFNGMTFVNIQSDAEIRTGANAVLTSYTSRNPTDPWEASWGITTPPYVFVPISTAQWNLLQQSYDALKQSVYDGLVMQTRLKPYLDTISLAIDDTGIQLDFAPLAAELQARFETQPAEAVRDLLDVRRVAGAQLTGSGWDGYQQLRGWLSDTAAMTDPAAKAALTATIIAGLNDFGYGGLRVNGDGTGGSEAVIGDDAGATLNGNGENETGQELRGKRRLISRRWRDGKCDVACANGGWRWAA